MPARSVPLLLTVIAASAALVAIAANVSTVRDALAVLVTVGLVAAFFGVRIIVYRLHRPDHDEVFDSWGGMNETMDHLLARYRRPGANPVLPLQGTPRLPDDPPTFEGHPLGEGHAASGPRRD